MVSLYIWGLAFQALIELAVIEAFHGGVSVTEELGRVLILQNQVD